MIDDERTQIGTLRALGYSRGSILAKYLLYSGSAAALGCVIGYFAGGYVFPFVIWTAYGMLYSIPGFVILYDPVLFVIALAASLLCFGGHHIFSPAHRDAEHARKPHPPEDPGRRQTHFPRAHHAAVEAPEIPAQGLPAQHFPL